MDQNRENLLVLPVPVCSDSDATSKLYVDPTKLFQYPVAALYDVNRSMWCCGGLVNSCMVGLDGILRPAPNAEFRSVYTDEGEFMELAVFATKEISCLQEVIVDYHWVLQDCWCCKHIK